MTAISIFAPAKLNLFLAVTGRRADGFHDLVSLVAPVNFGDRLQVKPAAEGFRLACDDPNVPLDDTNLVLKAARAFAAESGWRGGADFFLEKRIPMGAGLGGGSSDAVAALRALNSLAGKPLGPEALGRLAAQLGSDCPLFLHGAPVVMRGRGERVEALPTAALTRLSNRRVLIFKPAFGISTPWAYAQMAARPQSYLPASEAEARLQAWMSDENAAAEKLLFNNLEQPAFAKFLALPALLDELSSEFSLAPRMSGSGSACFALLRDDAQVGAAVTKIRRTWGDETFVIEARLTAAVKSLAGEDVNPH